jgi:hypothetical protein
MDEDSKKHLDKTVKEIQINVFAARSQALGIDEFDKKQIFAYIHAIAMINENFQTNYLSCELYNMKLTDSNNMVQNYIPFLPLKKGDENIFDE